MLCVEEHSDLGLLSDISGDNIICGVSGCANTANYYLDFFDKKEQEI